MDELKWDPNKKDARDEARLAKELRQKIRKECEKQKIVFYQHYEKWKRLAKKVTDPEEMRRRLIQLEDDLDSIVTSDLAENWKAFTRSLIREKIEKIPQPSVAGQAASADATQPPGSDSPDPSSRSADASSPASGGEAEPGHSDARPGDPEATDPSRN